MVKYKKGKLFCYLRIRLYCSKYKKNSKKQMKLKSFVNSNFKLLVNFLNFGMNDGITVFMIQMRLQCSSELDFSCLATANVDILFSWKIIPWSNTSNVNCA